MPKRTLPQPRSWLEPDSRSQFGRESLPTAHWERPQRAADRAHINAARSQHEFVRAVRTAIKTTPGVTTKTLARDLGIHVDQLRRVMRGESHLLLVDMHQLAARLGIPIYTGVHQKRP